MHQHQPCAHGAADVQAAEAANVEERKRLQRSGQCGGRGYLYRWGGRWGGRCRCAREVSGQRRAEQRVHPVDDVIAMAADCALRSPRGAGRVEHGRVVVGQVCDVWKRNAVFDLLHCAGPGLRAIEGLTSIASNQHGEQRAWPLLPNARPALAIDECHAAA